MLRHDLIKRLIEKMAAVIARLAALTAAGKLDEAEGELAMMERELGLPRGHELLEARSLSLLLGSADRLALTALVLWHQAEVAVERGEPASAARLERRARDLAGVVCRADLSPTALGLWSSHPLTAPQG